MRKILFSLILLFLIQQNLYGQWQLRYPELPEDKITDITFISDATGFFINENGAIYKTSDGGEEWVRVFFDGSSRFSEINFIDDQVGFAYARIGSCFTYTTDGGETWKQDDLDVHLAHSVIGFSKSEFLKTTESGIYRTSSVFGDWEKIYEVPVETIYGSDLSWEETIAIPRDSYQFSDSSLSVLYYNRYRGDYLQKKDSLYYLLNSNDRGINWDSVLVDIGSEIRSFTMVDRENGFLLTDEGQFYKTTDGAESWTTYSLPVISHNPTKVHAFTKNKIYLNAREQVLKSTNGGNTWEVIQVPQSNTSTGYSISRYNVTKIRNLQLKINDEGEEWLNGKNFINISGDRIYFKNKNTGWTFGGGQAYKTTDAGFTWAIDTTFPENPEEIFFHNESEGWMSGRNEIYYTDDSGQNWVAQNLISTDKQLYDNHILFDGNFGIIYANVNCSELSCGKLLVTKNKGDSWEQATVPEYFKSLSVSNGNIFGVGADKKLWSSSDKGKSWDVIYNYSDRSLYPKALVRSNENMIWLNIGSGSLAYSRDNGKTWGTTSAQIDEDMVLIGPLSRGNFYVYAPVSGNVLRIDSELHTYDKRDQQLPTDVGIEDISYVLDDKDIPHIWIKGWYNTVLYLKGPVRVIVSSELINKGIPVKTVLKQNYPNPFNPSTTISFDLAESGKVKLSVYDITGREVAVLQNNRFAAGSHSINFDASYLASGTYIYRLHTNNEVYSNTFTLIK